ncbi:MAG: TIGR02594 family protein [Sphingomonadales bacterium]|nr:TIGR02594 family protein [Sphingomonadales bacterium]
MKDHDAFMAAWRASRDADGAKIDQAEYDLVMAAIGGTWAPAAAAAGGEPKWLTIARSKIGQREIKGPKHNSWIAKGWARLGAGWFNDDETPWCGLFVAHCIDAAGLPIPKPSQFPRALAWLEWGKPCRPVLGAVVVFGRTGGGHVGFLVGESATDFYVLGGNQKNAVNIMPLAKDRARGFRWPVGLPLGTSPLLRMTGGVRSENEA